MTLTQVQQMTPEAKRIALAKLEGITRCPKLDCVDHFLNSSGKSVKCPHYQNDLNAVHRVEEKRGFHETDITNEMYENYRKYINYIRALRGVDGREHCASAAQRCDALLAVLLPDEGGEG